ncbi:MAG: serine/threonine-protein kinase [Cyanobacteria bacterium P01_D01_bin.1]
MIAQTQPVKTLFRDRFEIIRKVGSGGFASVYLAQDHTVLRGGLCVVKQIRYKANARKTDTEKILLIANPELAKARAKAKNQRRFRKEARIMARLGRHHQLPCLLDHFSQNDLFYLVQEYISGETLKQEFNRTGAQSEAQVRAFLREMVPVIRYIHARNLLHLDIKPTNLIRRSSDQKIVLVDFGAVRRYSKYDHAVSDYGCAATVGYAPPEQLAGRPTPASDLYALGVTCLYLLTGLSPIDLAVFPKGQDLRWQDTVQVSAAFHHVLEKLLAPDLKHRFQSINELENTMNRIKSDHDLKYCLTSEPMGDLQSKSAKACDLNRTCEGVEETYVGTRGQSQASRQAQSIRRWKQRRRQFDTFTPS